jgi:phosphopantothenoylcysteine decarboxylase/phosphopantothenate--cysteine ligase
LLIGTGALSAAFLPFWLNWLRQTYPRTERRVVLTHSALRFVSRSALAAIGGCEVLIDEWPADEATARHVELQEWAEMTLVYPATFQFVSRFSLGLAGSPVLLAMQCMTTPIGLAPALPPGGTDSPAYREHVDRLCRRPNVVIADPHPGRSVTTGKPNANVPADFSDLLELTTALLRPGGEST